MNSQWFWFWLCGACFAVIVASSAYYDTWRGGVRFFCLDDRYSKAYFNALWDFSRATLLPKNWEARLKLQNLADDIARQYNIDPGLFRALITQESNWDARAVSVRGAVGLTQLMPNTAAAECQLKRNQLFNIEKNLDCGARYFAAQYQRFGNIPTALCAYNAGPSITASLGRCPDYPETQQYVRRIMGMWKNQ